jgi:hypothetical protein
MTTLEEKARVAARAQRDRPAAAHGCYAASLVLFSFSCLLRS